MKIAKLILLMNLSFLPLSTYYPLVLGPGPSVNWFEAKNHANPLKTQRKYFRQVCRSFPPFGSYLSYHRSINQVLAVAGNLAAIGSLRRCLPLGSQ
jgi:hypothetical protein